MNKLIPKLSQQILEQLLEFRRKNPEFTFALREKDRAGSDEKRLENGCWFQGGKDYIYVPFFSKGDPLRKIKTIGFVIKFQESGGIESNYIEISIKGVKEMKDVIFHKELARELGISLNVNLYGYKYYPKKLEIINNLENFLLYTWPKIVNMLHKHGLLVDYIISEAEFQIRMDKVNEIQKKNGF